jgi:hypothetical protein
LFAKFVEGAWITIILVPAILTLFMRVRKHYLRVAREVRCPRALDLTHNDPPVVIVPLRNWDILSERALRFALRLSPDVICVHICIGGEDNEALKADWTEKIEAPIRAAGLPLPKLKIIPSPYRRLLSPLESYIDELHQEYPERIIAVIIPELVEPHWYHYLLHNQRAAWLKADLFLRGDRRVVVINIPWYLEEESSPPAKVSLR